MDTVTFPVSEIPADLADLVAAEGGSLAPGDYLLDCMEGPVAYLVERSVAVGDPASLKPGGGHPVYRFGVGRGITKRVSNHFYIWTESGSARVAITASN